MINVFLRFNKYKVEHIVVINGHVWENQGRIHLGHFWSDSNFHNYYNLNCELIP